MKALGRHILVEFTGCLADVLNDVSIIEKSMVEAAQIAGVSTRSWERLCDAGKAPRPARLSARLIRWRRTDISRWLDNGCEAE